MSVMIKLLPFDYSSCWHTKPLLFIYTKHCIKFNNHPNKPLKNLIYHKITSVLLHFCASIKYFKEELHKHQDNANACRIVFIWFTVFWTKVKQSTRFSQYHTSLFIIRMLTVWLLCSRQWYILAWSVNQILWRKEILMNGTIIQDVFHHHSRAESWCLGISKQQYQGAQGRVTCCQKGGGILNPDVRFEKNINCEDRIGEVKQNEGAC